MTNKYYCDNCSKKLSINFNLYYFPHENSLLCENCIPKASGLSFKKVVSLYYYERCEIDEDDDIIWRNKENEWHRENGSALEYKNGNKSWWLNGKPHRENGPARECANGDKEYYINDSKLTEKEFEEWRNKNGKYNK